MGLNRAHSINNQTESDHWYCPEGTTEGKAGCQMHLAYPYRLGDASTSLPKNKAHPPRVKPKLGSRSRRRLGRWPCPPVAT